MLLTVYINTHNTCNYIIPDPQPNGRNVTQTQSWTEQFKNEVCEVVVNNNKLL